MHDISDEQYEKLQEILERVYGKRCTYEEAKEIGDGLVDFFALLLQLDSEEEENAADLV